MFSRCGRLRCDMVNFLFVVVVRLLSLPFRCLACVIRILREIDVCAESYRIFYIFCTLTTHIETNTDTYTHSTRTHNTEQSTQWIFASFFILIFVNNFCTHRHEMPLFVPGWCLLCVNSGRWVSQTDTLSAYLIHNKTSHNSTLLRITYSHFQPE